ncbi:hypothetical protein DPMN_173091 [Dreissena polymorpha]|uniref:Uncharacterized protein n=1 Tax=Dreissena polymorpha TaxID=45954 RepID=A0A9D4E410_DREPO|nr:hypothetical protein DPMN_173091 [Dreissena polymorpha]
MIIRSEDSMAGCQKAKKGMRKIKEAKEEWVEEQSNSIDKEMTAGSIMKASIIIKALTKISQSKDSVKADADGNPITTALNR